MNNQSKVQIGRDITCISHSARSDRELYRICPSKLSKRELEDLYFALLENNLELKRTLNGQQEKIKSLSTKVQRMATTQKNAQGKETKECCVATKAFVNEQKDSIANLKSANERMAERIRVLNMRLCSAKQFLRRSPSGAHAGTRCSRCFAPAASLKNSSMSALNTKGSKGNLKPTASCQYLDKDAVCPTTRSVETETQGDETPSPGKPCDENKCRTMMEELQQKIVNLEEELSNTHEEYSSRISRLEREVSEVRKENVQVRGERVASEHELQRRTKQATQLITDLRTAEANCNELTMQLSLEKRKVAEMETQLRAASMSKNVAKSIEDCLTSNMGTIDKGTSAMRTSAINSNTIGASAINTSVKGTDAKGISSTNTVCMSTSATNTSAPQLYAVDTSTGRDENKQTKSSEDSGYMDANKSQDLDDDKGLNKLNDELIKKISDFESKLDQLKISTAAELSLDKRIVRPLDNGWDGSSLNNNEPHRDFNDISLKDMEVDREIHGYSLKGTPDGVEGNHLEGVDDGVGTSEKTYDDVLMYPEKSVITMRDELQAMHNSSKNYSMVINVDDEGTVKASPPAMNDAPGTSRDECLDKYDGGSEKEKSECVCKHGTNNEPKMTPRTNDHHNKHQIPGPLPTDNEDWKKSMFKRISVEVKTKNRNNRNKNDAIPVKEIMNNNGTRKKKNALEIPETNIAKNGNNSTGKPSKIPCAYNSDLKYAKDGPIREESENFASARLPPYSDSLGKDSVDVTRSRLNIEAGGGKRQSTSSAQNKYIAADGNGAQNSCHDCDQALPVEEKEIEYCQSKTRVCTCPAARHRNVSIFRTCSGTLRFKTTDAGNTKFRTCQCTREYYSNESCAGKDSKSQKHGSGRSVSSAEPHGRASPDNTDCEISDLTDLPSEKPVGHAPESRRISLSPGEDKATTTYTDSYTTPATTDYGSLSEGELPAQNTVRRVSLGEKPKNEAADGGGSPQQLEAALQAISHELARCKRLLAAQRPHQERISKPESRDAAAATALSPPALALRRANATQSIGDAHAPKCVFTLHIGTIVLTDEAVMKSRNKALMLTWKFYDQSTAMTRMHAGRVVLFDFSTEYDVKITVDFLDYMKHEEMMLIICEVDKQNEPFATCSLPLRDALHHTNRRADMSLALLAGPQMQGDEASADALDTGDEMGVLDLWCMLRAEPQLLPAINHAIAKERKQSGIIINEVYATSVIRIFFDGGTNKPESSRKFVKILQNYKQPLPDKPQKVEITFIVLDLMKRTMGVVEMKEESTEGARAPQSLSITVLWLALNQECEAMVDPRVLWLYVAYTFLGRHGADLETPVSLPKPKHYVDKCYFNFKKTFVLEDVDLPLLGHMARCRSASKTVDPKDCIVFTVVSEPPEDPLGLDNCEDIGCAYLYLGELLASSAGSDGYTKVVPVRGARGGAGACGVLAVRVDGLHVLRTSPQPPGPPDCCYKFLM